jgi:hypothetical protein
MDKATITVDYEKSGFSEVARSNFKVIYFHPEEKMLIEHWLPESKNMLESDFRQELLAYKRAVLSRRPEKVLVNSKDLHFVISPENQVWMAKEIFTAYAEAGMKKKAFLMPEDFFTQVSMEQHVQEDTTNSFVYGFFDDFDTAKKWLNE